LNVAAETWQILGEKLFHRKLKEKLVFQLCRKRRGIGWVGGGGGSYAETMY
jgi:hypothetical protein